MASMGGSVNVLERLFYLFKLVQFSVFVWWCVLFSEAALPLPSGTLLSTAVGGILILLGQILNLSVFYRLGKTGVFYGNRFGYQVPWCEDFPFSMFKHPQYVGTLISIWGFFLMMRFPYADWMILPLIETLYYWLGARYER
jgi:methylene-fatty-acyl-phospholipid synthase